MVSLVYKFLLLLAEVYREVILV